MAQQYGTNPETGTVRHTKDQEFDANVGFYGNAPVAQPAAVTDAAGGVTIDAEARTALNDLLAKLRTLGLIAT